MTKRLKLLYSFIIAFLLCLCVGIVPLFTSAPNKASAANPYIYPMRYGNNSMNTYYLDHWRTGQGSRVSGETSGKWYFGYGDVSASAYSFNQLPKSTEDAVDTARYKTISSSHMMSWAYNVQTRKYSSASTQTMFVFEAENDGLVSFTGIAAKGSNIETLAYTQNGCVAPVNNVNPGTVWLPDINATSDPAFAFNSGDSYTISMWLVKSSTCAELIMEKTFTSQFAYLFPHDQIRVAQGEKIVFGYKCNATTDEWKTNALWALSSEFTAETAPTNAYNFVGQSGAAGLATSYLNHWTAQGNTVSGQTNGTWRFGTGTVSTSAYSFSQAAKNTSDANDTKSWGTGSNMMSWGFVVGTSTTTASIYEMTATNSGSFTFSGIVSKATFNKENLAGVQNQCYSIWINTPGLDWNDGAYNWYNGDSYKVGMYKVATDGTVTALYEKTYTSQYAWLVPQVPISLQAGEKVVFSLQAVEFGMYGSVDNTATLMLLTSQATTQSTTATASVTNNSSRGTVTGITNGTVYNEGDVLDITITPKTGYKIASVTWNGVEQTVNANGMTLSKTVDITGANLVVNYVATYSVTITNNNAQGTVNANFTSGSTYEQGKIMNAVISAKTGYKISSVKWNGVEKLTGKVTSYTLNQTLTQNSSLVVTYVATVTSNVSFDSAKGSVSGITTGQTLYVGENVYISVTALDGYKIKSIYWNGSYISITNSSSMYISKTITTAGASLSVVYEEDINYYNLTLIGDTSKGTFLNFVDGAIVEEGTTLPITITANTNYVIASVKWNGVPQTITDNKTISFTKTIMQDVVLEVEFKNEYYVPNISVTEGGEIIGLSQPKYQLGTNLTITLVADNNYQISSVIYNGQAIEITDAEYMSFDTNVGYDGINIEVVFTIEKYTAVVNYDSDFGVVSGIMNGVKYAYGTKLVINIVPEFGYEISSVIFNGIIEEVTKSAMTLNKVVGEDGLSLSVEFAKKSPIASVEYDAEAVSVSGIVDGDAYLFGSQVTFVIEANAGYEITDIQWNGEYEDVDLSEGIVTLTKTIGDKGANLVVETARKKYVANIIAPKGSVNIKGIEHGKSYEMGTTLTIEITVNKGYELLTIFYNDEAVQFDLGAKKVVITKTVPIGKINLVIAAAPLPKGATGCALSLASALPVGSIMLAGAVAMLFIKKKRNND